MPHKGGHTVKISSNAAPVVERYVQSVVEMLTMLGRECRHMNRVVDRNMQQAVVDMLYKATTVCMQAHHVPADLANAVRAEGRVEHFADISPLLVVWSCQEIGVWPALHPAYNNQCEVRIDVLVSKQA